MIVSSLLASAGLAYSQTSKSPEADPKMSKQVVAIEHVRIESARPFADVRSALEKTVPRLDPAILNALAKGDTEQVAHEKAHGPELSIFLIRDHGALLQIAGRSRNALQYDIGNPITASLMTRHRLAAALYAPIRVVLYEDDLGRGVFEYDRPSSTFGQFGDEHITAVANGLDVALARVLLSAAH
jgi:hypothetical protein